MVLTFVTGPARAGKSRFAERLAAATGFAVTYVSTAPAREGETSLRERVEPTAARRPAAWRAVDLARPGAPALDALLTLAGERETIVIDTLDAWVAERARARGASSAADVEGDVEKVMNAIAASRAHVVVVGEEVGWGAYPEDPVARIVRDAGGRMHARLAPIAERAYLIVSGFALDLRTQGRAIDR
jgi:adenosylcobinamide kinase/adenosylcobinamide-phosphate guanylyltransferase